MLLLCLGGCLYLEEMNHAPRGTIEIEQSSARLVKLGSAIFIARAEDPDADNLLYQWQVQVKKLTDGKLCYLSQRTGPTNCKDNESAMAWSAEGQDGRRLVLDTLPHRGDYQVTLKISDELGARVKLQHAFKVANEAPQIKLLVGGDPAHPGDRVPDFNSGYPAHAHYLARISEKDLTDREKDLICGGKASIKWSIEAPASAKLEYQKILGCQGKQVLDRFRFRFISGSITSPAKVTIHAEVDDGYQGKAKTSLPLTLTPNRPPCLVGVQPLSFKEIGDGATTRVIASQGMPFEAPEGFVSDDVREILLYQWLVNDGKGFVVLPGENGPRYVVPAWFRTPGSTLRLRVVVRDVETPAPACAVDTALCAHFKPLPPSCYQWVTWKVKFQ